MRTPAAHCRGAVRLLALLAIVAGCRNDARGPPPVVTPIAGEPARLFVETTADVGLPPPVRWPDGRFCTLEITAGGVALLDYDNDGDLDIYQVCHPPPGDYPEALQTPAPNRLYQQQTDGSFREVAEQTRLGDPGYGHGVAVGDIDNDGDLDVYVCNYGPDHLYRQQGGTFADVTVAAGIADDHWTTSAGFFDYDRDGDLDLYVVRFGRYDPKRVCRNPDGEPDYCGPHQFDGLPDTLYRNNGDGTFVDVTRQAGIAVAARGWGLVFADVNHDDWPDVYVTNDQEPNLLWINRRDGTFADEAFERGVAFNGAGQTEASMGIAVADIDADGSPDLFMTHLAEETNTYLLSGGETFYRDDTARSGLGVPSLPTTGWGCAFFDYDHDGDLDLAVVNGRVMRFPVVPGAELGEFWNAYAEPNNLFENDGQGRFEDVGRHAAGFCSRVEISHGLAVGDLDDDGDVDTVVQNVGNTLRVCRNDAPPAGHHWLLVRPMVGRRDAYGAKVTVVAAERRITRVAHPTYSFAASNDPRAHFGLGGIARIEAVEVTWPCGTQERFPATTVDRVMVLRCGEGEPLAPAQP